MNTFYAIYNIATGIIGRTQSVSEEWDPLFTGILTTMQPGEAFINVPPGTNFLTGHIVNGCYVPYNNIVNNTASSVMVG